MTTRVVTYECLHSAIFEKPWPSVGDEIICARCRESTRVFQLAPEYAVTCGTCRFGRTFGADGKIRAGQSAAKHATARGHAVQLYFGDRKIETILPDLDTLPEPETDA